MRPVAATAVIILIFAATLRETYSVMTEEQLRKAAKVLVDICIPKTGTNQETLDAALRGEFPDDDRKFKCFVRCCVGMLNFVQDGKYNDEGVLKLANSMLPDGLRERSIDAIHACRQEWDGKDDECDAAYAFARCIYVKDALVLKTLI